MAHYDQPQGTRLAQFNWAMLVADLGSAEAAPFEAAVPRVNALAERSPGFVWRDGDERAGALALGWPIFSDDPRAIASFFVRETPAHLRDYVYKTVHGAFLRRRADWFVPGRGGHVLWWVPGGDIPTMAQARHRVESLNGGGPSPEAFTFAAPGAAPGADAAGGSLPIAGA